MKNGTRKRARRSYRLIGFTTFLLVVITVLLGTFVSEDAGIFGLFAGATVITLGAILSFAVESAVEIRREQTEACEVAAVSLKKPETLLTKR